MPDPKSPTSTAYHHGNLREALLEAAVQLAEQIGPDNVSVREVAKRVGVSPGAPFRHFSSKIALMTAVAEQAMTRFRAEITNAVDDVTSGDPLERFAAVGVAYLRWAIQNPTHFQIISTRNLIDWGNSESLKADNGAIRALMEETLVEAKRRGLLRSDDLVEAQIAGRALVYGLARMYIDGHFAQWGVDGETAERTSQNVLKHLIALMGKQ
jgi:AcrR family transcriptional regulator